MSENIKDAMMRLAMEDFEKLLLIIGELGYPGYQICLTRLRGGSWQLCANKHKVTRKTAICAVRKCKRLGYEADLRRLLTAAPISSALLPPQP